MREGAKLLARGGHRVPRHVGIVILVGDVMRSSRALVATSPTGVATRLLDVSVSSVFLVLRNL